MCLVLSRNRGIYRPMEDYTSKQRQCLSRIVTFALELPYKLNKTTGPGLGLDVVHAIVLVEHRDVQEHMGIIWSLLWKDVPEPPGLSIPRSVPLTTSSTQLAIALVKAHAELRQLEAMFDSLVSSMPPFGRVHMPIAFRRACKDAISSAPSGQSVSFVRMVGRWIESSAGNNLENVAGLGHLCLCSVNCQLMTAPGIADACVQVIHALQTKVGQEVNGITPPIVVLYTEAVRVHQTCCRLHPKVISLHGQQAGSVETGFFFSALLPKIGNDKSVWEHIQQWEGELLVAAGFHLQTLHQRILSARYDCCDVGIDVDGFKGSVDDGSKTRLVYESNVEEARYLARILVKHAGRLVFPIEGRGNEKTDIKMLNMLYVCFNSDTGDSFELMTPSDEDTGSGMPIAVRMAINLLVEEPSLLEAIVSKPVGLNDTKKLGAVAYNLVGRLLASKDDHDEEIVRQRLALFPEKDLTLSIAVGRWMRLLLR